MSDKFSPEATRNLLERLRRAEQQLRSGNPLSFDADAVSDAIAFIESALQSPNTSGKGALQ